MRKGSDGDPGELAADKTSFGVGGGGGRVAGRDSGAWVDGTCPVTLTATTLCITTLWGRTLISAA